MAGIVTERHTTGRFGVIPAFQQGFLATDHAERLVLPIQKYKDGA